MSDRWMCLAILAATSGCSFVAVRAPHAATAETKLDCTSSSPTLDVVGAVIGLGAAAVLAYRAATTTGPGAMDAALAGGFIGIPAGVAGLTYTASGIYGAHVLARCRRLQRQQRAMNESDATTRAARERVQTLVDEAARHAREGRCDRVATIAREVRTLFPDHYVLVRDNSDIARCNK